MMTVQTTKSIKDIVNLLVKGGYERHKSGNGYVKNIDKKGRVRYHAFIRKNALLLHIDKTRGYRHVLGSTYPLKGELRKLGFRDEEIVAQK